MKKAIVVILIITIMTGLSADVVILKNWQRLNGEITGNDTKQVYIITSSGEKVKINWDSILKAKKDSGYDISKLSTTRYPNDFNKYALLAYNDTLTVEQDTLNTNYDIATELHKMNKNLTLIYAPMWIGLAISVVSMIVTAQTLKKVKK